MDKTKIAQYIIERHKQGYSFASIRESLIKNNYPVQIVDEQVQNVKSRYLINFITVKNNAGYPKDSIKNILLNEGYSPEEINKGFLQSGIGSNTTQNLNRRHHSINRNEPNFNAGPPQLNKHQSEKTKKTESSSFISDIISKFNINDLIGSSKNSKTQKNSDTQGINPYYMITGAFLIFFIVVVVLIIGFLDSEEFTGHERPQEEDEEDDDEDDEIEISIREFQSSYEELTYSISSDNILEEDSEVNLEYSIITKTGEEVLFEERESINLDELDQKEFLISFDEELAEGDYILKKNIVGEGLDVELEEEFEIDKTSEDEFSLTINVTGEGKTNPGAGTHKYSKGQDVNVNVSSDDGWKFVEFEGDCIGSSCNITMNEDKEVTANFAEDDDKDDKDDEKDKEKHQLKIEIEGEGNTTPEVGNHSFNKGDNVTINTTPDKGWEFVEFSGDCTDSNCNVIMDEDKEITAVFVQKIDYDKKYNLTVNVLGQGNTTPEAGNHSFHKGKNIEINTTPHEDRVFDEFLGDCTGSICNITMDENKEVMAVFAHENGDKYQLTINKEGQGNTTPEAGEHLYPEGVELTLVAYAKEGWEFVEFSGDCTDSNCNVTMDSDKTITAKFEEENGLPIEREGVTSANDVAEAFIDIDEVEPHTQIDNFVTIPSFIILDSNVGETPVNTIKINELPEEEDSWNNKKIFLADETSYEMVYEDIYALHYEVFGLDADSEEVAEAFYKEFDEHGTDSELDGNEITLGEDMFLPEESSDVIGNISDDKTKIEFNSADENWEEEKLTVNDSISRSYEVAKYSYKIIDNSGNKVGGFSLKDMDREDVVSTIGKSLENLDWKDNFLYLSESSFDIEESSDVLIEDTWKTRIDFDDPSEWPQEETNELTLEIDGEEVTYIFEYESDEELLKIFEGD